jgi:hypothetical protein
MNMPVPIAKQGGTKYDQFAIVSIEHSINHLLAHGVPLMPLDYYNTCDWKDSDGDFRTLFHKELFAKMGNIENSPSQLRIHKLFSI